MGDHSPSPSASSSSATAVCRRDRRHYGPEEEDPVACTGKSCQSCTAGVIADCVAVCCCPCAVVNILTLAFVKLPWALARKCLGRRKGRSRRRMLEEEERRKCEEDIERGLSEIVLSCDHFSAGGEDVWLELYEVGHLGFGSRVSFTKEIPNKGD